MDDETYPWSEKERSSNRFAKFVPPSERVTLRTHSQAHPFLLSHFRRSPQSRDKYEADIHKIEKLLSTLSTGNVHDLVLNKKQVIKSLARIRHILYSRQSADLCASFYRRDVFKYFIPIFESDIDSDIQIHAIKTLGYFCLTSLPDSSVIFFFLYIRLLFFALLLTGMQFRNSGDLSEEDDGGYFRC